MTWLITFIFYGTTGQKHQNGMFAQQGPAYNQSAYPHRFQLSIKCTMKIDSEQSGLILGFNMSPVVRKSVFGVSDQVRHKPGCTATEDG